MDRAAYAEAVAGRPLRNAWMDLTEQDLAFRGELLPIGKAPDGSRVMAVPGMVREGLGSILGLLDAGNEAFQGRDHGLTVDEAMALPGVGGGLSALLGRRAIPEGIEGALAANVWHGTPHRYAPEPDFPHGRPRLDKIGTGEGAQVYGHGWYSAENKAVGKDYFDTFNDPDQQPLSFLDRPVDEIWNDGIKERWSDVIEGMTDDQVDAFTEVMGNLSQVSVLEDVKHVVGNLSPDAKRMFREVVEPKLAKPMPDASLYQFDIPDDAMPKLMDWDAPLSEQGEVGQSVRRLIDELEKPSRKVSEEDRALLAELEAEGFDMEAARNAPHPYDNMTGQQAYNRLSDLMGAIDWPVGADAATRSQFRGNAQAKASDRLRDLGIPGLRYADGMSRGKTGGTSNYVIWDQDVLDRTVPLERNSVPTGLNPGDYDRKLLRMTDEEAAKLSPVERMDIAQRNAALPKEKGGLGLPADNTPEMRAEAMGFDTDAYHATNKDFASFKPSWRGSNYLGQSAEGAHRGASFGSLDYYGAKDAANITMPLRLRSGDVKGLSINRTAWDKMPDKILSDDEFRNIVTAERLDELGLKYSDDIYESVYQKDGTFLYYKKDPPEVKYQDLNGRDVSGDLLGGFNTGTDLKSLENAKKRGKLGFLVSDEAGTSIAFGPEMPIRSRFAAFDPARSGSADLLAANPASMSALSALMAQREQQMTQEEMLAHVLAGGI